MTFNVDSTSDSECITTKFWKHDLDDTDSPEISSTENSSRRLHHNTTVADDTTTSYEYTIGDRSNEINKGLRPQPLIRSESNLTIFNTSANKTKRYQTKMLLASLIEHFCRAYGDSPNANRKVFFLICQTLRSLGIIDAEFVDEMTSVRSSFQQAFHKLFYTAVQTVRNQDLIAFDDHLPRLIQQQAVIVDSPEKTRQEEQEDYFSTAAANAFHSPPNSKLSSSDNTLHSFIQQGGDDFFHNLSIQNSRYNNDFVEISLLGKGGFASAFRARNKLDGIDYAVKKIRLGNDYEENSDNPYEKIFREIKNLARLEHVNVIRYYSSWLEFDEQEADEATDGSDWEDDTSRPQSFISTSSSVFEGKDPTFDDSNSPSESGMSHIQFGGDSSGGYEAGGNESTTTHSSFSKPSYSTKQKPVKQSGWTLFIQMQLCPTTLHDYIRFRNRQYADTLTTYGDPVDIKRNIEIFNQILQGTAYIHDQGLIHRDLKPSNIFLSMSTNTNVSHHDHHRHHHSSRRRASSAGGCLENTFASSFKSEPSSYDSQASSMSNMWEENWVPKIGDFGLAAEVMDANEGGLLMPSTPPSPQLHSADSFSSTLHPLSMDSSGKPKRPKPRRTRTIGVGTRTYASPEQLAVPAQPYDEKVDIYSLGIILFELFQPFTTGMERADSIEKLKQGVFPDGFLELHPKISALILWMMNTQADYRPNVHQLLEFELFSSTTSKELYQTSLQTQLQTIQELKRTVERVELEKQEMQLRMEQMQCEIDQLKGITTTTTMPGGVKKCIISQSHSYLKKKKEVRWSHNFI